MANKHFLYFLKFFKHWAAATVLVVVPNALYLLVVDKNYSMTPTNMYTISQLNDRCLELSILLYELLLYEFVYVCRVYVLSFLAS